MLRELPFVALRELPSVVLGEIFKKPEVDQGLAMEDIASEVVNRMVRRENESQQSETESTNEDRLRSAHFLRPMHDMCCFFAVRWTTS